MSLKDLARYAEGGSTKSRSEEILDYLLGRSPTSRPVNTVTQAPVTGSPLVKEGDGKYVWDNITGTYKWTGSTPAVQGAAQSGIASLSGAGAGDSGSGGTGIGSGFGALAAPAQSVPNDGMSYKGNNSLFGLSPTQIGMGLAGIPGALIGTAVDRGINSMEDAARNQALAGWNAVMAAQTPNPDSLFGFDSNISGIGGSGTGFGFGSQGETAPGGFSFGADLGYDSPTGGDSDAMGAAADAAAADSGGYDSAAASADAAASDSSNWAAGGLAGIAARYAQGGYSLGDYSDGGRLLRGPGDGVSDDIPATIADKQPARLANNEFVIPARIVSEIGNGSTDAGARKLYAMMDRVQKARAKTVGKNKVAVDSKAYRELDKL